MSSIVIHHNWPYPPADQPLPPGIDNIPRFALLRVTQHGRLSTDRRCIRVKKLKDVKYFIKNNTYVWGHHEHILRFGFGARAQVVRQQQNGADDQPEQQQFSSSSAHSAHMVHYLQNIRKWDSAAENTGTMLLIRRLALTCRCQL